MTGFGDDGPVVTISGPPAEPRGVQREHELATGDDDGALLDGHRPRLGGDVVVVAGEGPPGYADPRREGVELIE